MGGGLRVRKVPTLSPFRLTQIEQIGADFLMGEITTTWTTKTTARQHEKGFIGYGL